MSNFFIERPIVAIVIAILTVLLGGICLVTLPVAQYPEIVPPVVQVNATYFWRRCADHRAIGGRAHRAADERRGQHAVHVFHQRQQRGHVAERAFRRQDATEYRPDSDADARVPGGHAIAHGRGQLRRNCQENDELAAADAVAVLARGTHDRNFLANYAYINMVDDLLRTPGVGDTLVYGGRYAMRIWVKPDQLAKLQVTVPEIARAIQQQNTVNPAGQVGGEPRRRARNSPTRCARRGAS